LVHEAALEGPLEDGLAEAVDALQFYRDRTDGVVSHGKLTLDGLTYPYLLTAWGNGNGQCAELGEVDGSQVCSLLALVKEILLPSGIPVPREQLRRYVIGVYPRTKDMVLVDAFG
jgi:hypothetical protein